MFSEDVPQHIANSLWGLSKMVIMLFMLLLLLLLLLIIQDASWTEMPSKNLEEAFCRCESKYGSQELSNCIYGIALLDASWNSLDRETKIALHRSLKRLAKSMTVQV